MKTIDLTTLQGWNNLPNGTYSVTVGAKATGYTRIIQSQPVSVVKESPVPVGDYFLTFSSINGTQFDTSMLIYNWETWEEIPGISWDGTVEYSTDKTNWTIWDGTSVSSSLNGEIYFRGTGNTYFDDGAGSGRFVFNITNDTIAIKGNIENLLDYEEVSLGSHPVMADGCFAYLFGDMSGEGNNIEHTNELILPATTLADSCYKSMFSGCTSLTAAPALPATTLADSCYRQMFYGCTSLTTAPSLPATTLADSCYSGMFDGCTDLTTAPALQATNLRLGCYQSMFSGCTSLTSAPALPATTLASGCYRQMFNTCTSLTSAPTLPATTLANNCYTSMFSDCTSLYVSDTQTAEASYEWRIPTNDVITGEPYEQFGMFVECLGTRASDNLAGAVGQQYVYYTQNPPVGSN